MSRPTFFVSGVVRHRQMIFYHLVPRSTSCWPIFHLVKNPHDVKLVVLFSSTRGLGDCSSTSNLAVSLRPPGITRGFLGGARLIPNNMKKVVIHRSTLSGGEV